MKKLGALIFLCAAPLQATKWVTLHEHAGPSHTLVFAPHPDDDVIGCGGTIIKHVSEGKNVAVVYMTSGEAGMVLPVLPRQRAVKREREATRAARHLGVHKIMFLRFPDGALRMHDTFLSAVRSVIDTLRPQCIYTPHPDDGHSDHQMTHCLVAEALRGIHAYTPTHLKYEVWTPLTHVDHLEDVSTCMPQKLAALCMHESQIALIAYNEAIAGLNKFRGIMDGAMAGMPCAYAEAFGK